MHRSQVWDSNGMAKAHLSQTEAPSNESCCRIEITPTPEQYRQLCHDLDRLREDGMPSNTASILRAVSLLADCRIGAG